MKMLHAKYVSVRDLLATAWPIVLITAVGFVVAYQFVQPAPPRQMTITTGGEAGAYYAYAKRYAALLAAKGITLNILTSAGSVQNLERLKKSEADIAFVQGGVHEVIETRTMMRCHAVLKPTRKRRAKMMNLISKMKMKANFDR